MNFKIFNGRNAFYQWDVNQKLILSGMTSACEIHFKNVDARNAYVLKPYEHLGFYVVDVPNILLQKANSITVWVYVNGEYTNEQAVFNVIPRQKPADYIYTETEVLSYEVFRDDVKTLKEDVKNFPNNYAVKNHTHNYLTSETDPNVCDWAKKDSEYNVTGNPVTLENFEYMPMNVVTVLEPKQAGSSDPSPDNIRPITGYNALGLNHAGKNLFDFRKASLNQYGVFDENGRFTNTAGEEAGTEQYNYGFQEWNGRSGMIAHNVIMWESGRTKYTRTITVQPDTTTFCFRLFGIRECAIWIENLGIPAGTKLTFSFDMIDDTPGRQVVDNIQIEFGGSATDYKPGHFAPYTVQIGQTVYGGKLGWLTGKGVIEWGASTLTGNENWRLSSSGNSIYFTADNVIDIGERVLAQAGGLCSHFPVRNFSASDEIQGVGGWDTAVYLRWASSFKTVDELKAFLSAQNAAGTPVQIAYKLAEPVEIPLDAHEIEAVNGVNTLYGDGVINVSGRKDIYYLVENLVKKVKTLEGGVD